MRWDRAIIQQGDEVGRFAATYLAGPKRRCALICGSGFDPRTLALPAVLQGCTGLDLTLLCLREERTKPQPNLRPVADRHEADLIRMFAGRCSVHTVNIFDEGGGVVGGRRVVAIVESFLSATEAAGPITDVLVDISALSCGVFFPIVAQLLQKNRANQPKWNVHLFVTENPQIDIRIRGEVMDTVSHIHGYRSRTSLSQTSDHALLWVPVLAEDNAAPMRQIFDHINQLTAAVDVSPIVPFPGMDPRRPDCLVEHYRELIGDWQIDPRHFLYAAESDPLDSYRSITEIDRLRHATYDELGGSSTIVSPLGSKMLSVGLMMAAIERELRVVYVECLGYEELAVPMPNAVRNLKLPITHIWLDGEIYGGLV